MKKLVGILVLLVMGGIVWFYVQEDTVLSDIRRDELIQNAQEYLASNPIVDNSNGNLRLDQYWKQSHLGGDESRRLDIQWIRVNEPLVYPIGGDKWGVVWKGMPGCKLDKPLELGYEPVLVDEKGKVCGTWWQVTVEVDNKVGQRSLEIREIGYGEDLEL